MRSFLVSFSAIALLLVAAAPSTASTLNLTGSTLGVSIGALPPVAISQSPDPVPLLVSSFAGSFSEAPGLFSGSVVLPQVLFTGVSLVSSLNVTAANASGSFSAGGGPGGGFGGAQAILGQAVVGVQGGLINVVVPLSVAGAGGQTQQAAFALVLSVTGHPWTTGVAQVTGVTRQTASGAFVNTVTLSGYDNRAANHAGALQLVTPIRILSNVLGSVPAFATQTLTFVPEPGMLLLLGSAIGALVALGRGRRRG
jgi:hypothetical protein